MQVKSYYWVSIMRYDIAIIGSGPAGLSAAINAKIRNKTIIMFGMII
ncbi:pyridine nucleotide-disulfide oxidoreductase family protein [Clostridioides difficile DA00165]|nr:pyridine nucleotide-disulfide oxidoreductase family protein [Clostridioides difficile DA00165]